MRVLPLSWSLPPKPLRVTDPRVNSKALIELLPAPPVSVAVSMLLSVSVSLPTLKLVLFRRMVVSPDSVTRSMPSPPSRMSLPNPPLRTSLPVFPRRVSLPVLPIRASLPPPPSTRSLPASALIMSLAPSATITSFPLVSL